MTEACHRLSRSGKLKLDSQLACQPEIIQEYLAECRLATAPWAVGVGAHLERMSRLLSSVNNVAIDIHFLHVDASFLKIHSLCIPLR